MPPRSPAGETTLDRFNDQGASRVRLEVVDGRQKVRAHGAQALRTVEGCLDVRVTLVRKADNEREVSGDAVVAHFGGDLVHLLDLDVLADALEDLVRS